MTVGSVLALISGLLLASCSGDPTGDGEEQGADGLACQDGQVRSNDGRCHDVAPPAPGPLAGEGEGEGGGEGPPDPPEDDFDPSVFTDQTCPPRRIITTALCTDPVTSCICQSPPVTCREGFKCIGGGCYPPGQRSVDECSPDRNVAEVALDLGSAPGGVATGRGEVNVERTADGAGWALYLPTSVPGGALASVRVEGDVEPPVAEGEVVDVTTCRHHTGGETLKIFVGLDILLLVTSDATYVQGDDCIPPDFKPNVLDMNCPPAWLDGDSADTACRTCVSPGLAFGGGRPTLSGQVGRVSLAGTDYAVVSGQTTRDCFISCCDEAGSRSHAASRLDYALVAAPR